MRPSIGFIASSPSSSSSSSSPPLSHPRTVHLSSTGTAWQSPVPYLFGGIAAMLSLIAFALLILACSYWKLSGDLEGDETARDAENGGGGVKDMTEVKAPRTCVCEQRIVVIMAGDEKPSFLATPISSRASSFGDHGSSGDHGGCGAKKKVDRPMVEDEETRGNEQIN